MTDIHQLETDIWQQLLRASVDKHHEWRSPMLVTNALNTDSNQWPEARTIILRKVNIDSKTLTFYTDSRSPKVAQINANPHATLVFWSKRLNWQLRVKVTMRVEIDNELTKKTWAIVKQSPSAGDYLSEKAPGEKLDVAYVGLSAIKDHVKPCFAMLIADINAIDWLALNRNGHQRAQINETGVTHLVP